MRIRHVEIFHAIYTTGSVTGAAKLLNVSQPAVSKVLAHAEAQLGYRLFERVKGRLIPTPEAHELFHQVVQVYDNLQRLRELSQNLAGGDKNSIRLSVTPAFAQEVVPRAIGAFLQDHPGMHVKVNTRHHSEVTRALVDRKIDLGLVFEQTSIPGLVDQEMGRAEFVILSPPGWFSGAGPRLHISALAGKPFILLNARGPLGLRLKAQLERTDVEWQTVSTVGTYHIAKSLASQGVGATIVDEVTARSGGYEGLDLWYLDPGLQFKIKALWPENAPLSVLSKALMGALHAELTSLLQNK